MPVKKKAKVIIAFALRLLLTAPSASRLHPMHSSIFTSNPAISIVRLQVMTLLACQVSVISATIPCAKPFFSVFSSGIMGRPRASVLPTSRPTMQREWSGPGMSHFSRDRGHSINKLHLQPQRGITFASAEYVPVQSTAQRPSLSNSKHYEHSISYSRDFEVSFQDVGGLLNAAEKNDTEPLASKCRPSLAGFSWRRTSGGKLSQKSNADSSQHYSPGPDT
jgi:hypothetical protein